uniref:Uncharacterized protein n=1 Tax=Daphnia galeata TaxID=27404 RepID=A0A8J2RSP0_9CRUS|nr:unnamed protein product [Daphnia galeata]
MAGRATRSVGNREMCLDPVGGNGGGLMSTEGDWVNTIACRPVMSVTGNNCKLYVYACYGGVGKRNEQQTNEKSVDQLSDQIWPTPNWNPTGTDEPSTLIQDRGRNTNPLDAIQLELGLVNNDIPRSAEHSGYLNQEHYNA